MTEVSYCPYCADEACDPRACTCPHDCGLSGCPVTVTCRLDQQWLGYWGEMPSGIPCGEPSFARVSLACVHEHIDEVRICPGCALDMQKAGGMLTCPRCWASERSHDCYCLVVIDWDSGEKTTVQEPHRG